MKVKHAIFDLDGTLLDSNGVWIDSVFDYIEGYCDFKRSDIPEEFERDIIFGGTYESLRYLRERMGDKREYSETLEIIMSSVTEKYEHERPKKSGAADLLERLQRCGADICIVSATPTHLVEKALERSGLSDYFDFIISGEERKSGKEKPYIFLEAASRMNCEVSECTLFEDALYSIKTGKSLGMTTVCMEDFFCKNDAREEILKISDYYVTDYSQLTIE